MKKGENTMLIAGFIVISVVLAIVLLGGEGTDKVATDTRTEIIYRDSGSSQAGCNLGTLSTWRCGAYDAINGTRDDVNFYRVLPDGSFSLGETRANNALTSCDTSAPNSFSGDVYAGNDNQVGTDRGTDVYFHKQALNYNCEATPTTDNVKVYAEGTLTLTVYDDGTAETSPNITVSTANVDTTKVALAVSANSVFGNPDFARPIAFCANATVPTNWDAIRPINYASTIPIPEFLAGRNMIGGSCFVLDTPALMDGVKDKPNRFEHYVRLDPAANPGTEQARFIYIDKTYYVGDDNAFHEGWEDQSDVVADADIGAAVQSVDNQIF